MLHRQRGLVAWHVGTSPGHISGEVQSTQAGVLTIGLALRRSIISSAFVTLMGWHYLLGRCFYCNWARVYTSSVVEFRARALAIVASAHVLVGFHSGWVPSWHSSAASTGSHYSSSTWVSKAAGNVYKAPGTAKALASIRQVIDPDVFVNWVVLGGSSHILRRSYTAGDLETRRFGELGRVMGPRY